MNIIQVENGYFFFFLFRIKFTVKVTRSTTQVSFVKVSLVEKSMHALNMNVSISYGSDIMVKVKGFGVFFATKLHTVIHHVHTEQKIDAPESHSKGIKTMTMWG